MATEIFEWLKAVSESGEVHEHAHHPALQDQLYLDIGINKASLKRKTMADNEDVDATPQPRKKRSRTGAKVLSQDAFSQFTPSETSGSIASSRVRSQSPTKAKRLLQFATPSVKFRERSDFDQDRSQLEARSPQLRQLLDVIQASNSSLPEELKVILHLRMMIQLTPYRTSSKRNAIASAQSLFDPSFPKDWPSSPQFKTSSSRSKKLYTHARETTLKKANGAQRWFIRSSTTPASSPVHASSSYRLWARESHHLDCCR